MILFTATIFLINWLMIFRNKLLNKVHIHRLYRQFVIIFLCLLVFIIPLFINPLNYFNDAAFASGNVPCATPGKDGPSTASTIVNTYFAATTGTLNSGQANTTITLGTQFGSSTTVSVGDMLLLIQMQDASINSSNTDSYGDGISGGGDENPLYVPMSAVKPAPPSTGASGYTAINNAGNYEFVTVTNVTGGGGSGSTIAIQGTGTNNGLINTYTSAAYSGAKGQSSYQIIRVPQYSSLTLSNGATVTPWNGSVGGVFAVDVAGTLTLSGTLNLYGVGFRGGAGVNLGGDSNGLNTDYRTLSNKAYNGSKGEGFAGTPRYVLNYFNPTTLSAANENPTTTPTLLDTTVEGYPNGSFGRGAPANAGGGSTDGDPPNNDQNSGGGGGGNGGNGGVGGRAWSSEDASGGYGGEAVTLAVINGGQRLFMGGGGGAGTTNNASESLSRAGFPGTNFPAGAATDPVANGIYSSGGAGGGIAILRANAIAGAGTIDVRGVVGLSTGRDGAGGGGGGGTAYIIANSSTAAISVNAVGGNGGWATFAQAHGPGGGGGGGVVVNSAAVTVSSSLAGGLGGETGRTNNADTTGWTNNAAGGTGLSTTIPATNNPGIQTGQQCLPNLTVTKTTSTPTIVKPSTGVMTATYTIAVSNASLKSPATNVVISDLLPAGFTYASTTSITLSAGATRPTTSNPTVGDTNPNWGTFTIPGAESVTIVFNVSIPNAQALGTYQNPATATYADPARTVAGGTTTAAYNSASSTGEDVTIIASTPKLLLAKRITNVTRGGSPITPSGSDNLSIFNDDPSTTVDNDPNWPTPNTYLKGAINGGLVAPSDRLEYTIYFLSAGNTDITNVTICDLVPANTTFVNNTYNGQTPIDTGSSGGNLGIALASNSVVLPTTPTVYASSAIDGDRGSFYPAGIIPTPNPCSRETTPGSGTYVPISTTDNANGLVVFNIVKSPTIIPKATSAGTPTDSYGFVRFAATVN